MLYPCIYVVPSTIDNASAISQVEAAEVNAPAAKPRRRRRSRSSKRSLSTPPRLGEAPKVGEAFGVGISAVPTSDKLSTHAQAKGKYYKEKPTGMANSGNIQPPQISLSSTVAGLNHFSPEPGESQKGKSKEIPPDFPLPPEANATAVLASTLPGWRTDNNYCCSDLGRIWIVWDPSVSVLVFKKTEQFMLCSIKMPLVNRSFVVAFVYGKNTDIERRLLWEDISELSAYPSLIDTPWALVGDFNQIAATNEHFSIIPSSIPLRGMEDFQDCLRDNELEDLPSRGVFYTWSNHQQDNPVIRKLDRALVNGEWLNCFPNSIAVFDPPGDSDHAPCIINLDTQPERSKKTFRYFSFISTHPTFLSAMSAAWDSQILVGSAMFSLGEHLKAAKKCCKELNRQGFGNIQDRTRQALTTLEEIKEMVVAYYSHLLGTPSNSTEPFSVEKIQSLQPFRCSSDLAAKLIEIPSEEEITSTLFAMPRNKAPGPDGFSSEFFWESWQVVKESTVAAVREFFQTGHLLRKFNTTALTLIPKVPGADQLSMFRPVACCNTVYKIITRLISKRLKLFIPDAVLNNQVGFIKGRFLCENVLLASELVENFHVEGLTTRGCLQIDLSKAYDNVNWDFLINILTAMSLPDVFINWIRVCISSPSYSIAFNGELVGFFQGKKGIRQGDPMSSHLFVLVMDILARSLDKGVVDGLFQPHPKCYAPLVTHLSFADDVLVFFDGSESSIEGILHILEDFKKGSGLGINRQKTALMLDGGNFEHNRLVSERFGLTHGGLPVRYLGVPLSSHKMRKQDFQPLIDKINYRFSSWTARHLSFAGRLQLLKSVIYSTISFWASIFILPNQCISKLEQMCNAFLWRGAPNSARGAKISWEVICTSKESGGLGLRRLSSWNTVLALKLIWLLFTAAGSLWVSWVRLHLIGNRSFWTLNPASSGSWVWKKLCKLRSIARPFLVCEVTGLPLMSVVRDAVRGTTWWISSSRSRNPIISLLREALPGCESVLECQHDDTYLWKPDHHAPSNRFCTAKTWLALNPSPAIIPWTKSVWFKGSIPKHAFITWVVAWNRLHTRDRLRRWGLVVPAICILCNSQNESRDHLFFECSFSQEIWLHFTQRTNHQPPPQFMTCLLWLKTSSRNKNVALILKLLYQASIYLIWRERNQRIHLATPRTAAVIIKEIKVLVRARLDPLSRDQPTIPPAWFLPWASGLSFRPVSFCASVSSFLGLRAPSAFALYVGPACLSYYPSMSLRKNYLPGFLPWDYESVPLSRHTDVAEFIASVIQFLEENGFHGSFDLLPVVSFDEQSKITSRVKKALKRLGIFPHFVRKIGEPREKQISDIEIRKRIKEWYNGHLDNKTRGVLGLMAADGGYIPQLLQIQNEGGFEIVIINRPGVATHSFYTVLSQFPVITDSVAMVQRYQNSAALASGSGSRSGGNRFGGNGGRGWGGRDQGGYGRGGRDQGGYGRGGRDQGGYGRGGRDQGGYGWGGRDQGGYGWGGRDQGGYGWGGRDQGGYGWGGRDQGGYGWGGRDQGGYGQHQASEYCGPLTITGESAAIQPFPSGSPESLLVEFGKIFDNLITHLSSEEHHELQLAWTTVPVPSHPPVAPTAMLSDLLRMSSGHCLDAQLTEENLEAVLLVGSKAVTSVYWDMETCPVPLGCAPRRISPIGAVEDVPYGLICG
ncbi:Reverse transcriptase zinc-binding domain [Arabidopsis suecica]|uniref:Reverse transcriptase zinc-binding domain n=1 Tax=Arabidopsis suecica TaxID=45249 RepID=A0A8T2BMJ5_ARASU|nr:Reverse transcriptase zinc-binding domain [Arabidopsis suecica]